MEIKTIQNSLYIKLKLEKKSKEPQQSRKKIEPYSSVSRSEICVHYPKDSDREDDKLTEKEIQSQPLQVEKDISEDEENPMYNVDCCGDKSEYVKIFTQNNYVFIIKRKILEVTSKILKRMLIRQSKDREITTLHFKEIRPDVMKEFCLYATYSFVFRYSWKPEFWVHQNENDPYHDIRATRALIGSNWNYTFPKHLTYDLYVLANYFMC